MSRRTWFLALAILAAVAAIELAMGRNPICTCGSVDLWAGARDSPKTSQMVADWYSLSHIVHGLLFYGALWLVARRLDVGWRFLIALSIEAGWEVCACSALWPWFLAVTKYTKIINSTPYTTARCEPVATGGFACISRS